MISYFKKIIAYRSYISIECMMTCIYFLCVPFTIVTTPFGSLLKLITYPITAMLLYKLFIGKKRPLKFNSVHFIYSIYIIITFMGLLMLRFDQSVIVTKDMLLSYFVAMMISIRVYNQYERELIEHCWIVVGLICIWLCMTSTQVANEFENRTVVYILGCKEDPNQFCAYFIMPTMVVLKRITQWRRGWPLYIVMLLLIFYCVFRTGSRGGLLGIVIGIAFYVWFGTKSLRLKLMYIGIGAVVAVLLVTVLIPLLPEDVQQRYTIENVESNGGSGRTEVWEFLIEYTAEKPGRIIHGSGIMSTYPILEAQKWNPTFKHVRAAHNQFVQVFVDQGIIGLFVYIMIMAVCILRNLKKYPEYSSGFVAIMTFALSLTMYVFKPYINMLMMCAMNFEDQVDDSVSKNQSKEKASHEKAFWTSIKKIQR